MADQIIYDLKQFYTQPITCSNCGWQGTGTDTIIIDMYGIGDVRQVTCPNCDNFLGSLPREEEPKPETPDELSDQIG
jgi:formate dehydrogenase maturation protein FdhE